MRASHVWALSDVKQAIIKYHRWHDGVWWTLTMWIFSCTVSTSHCPTHGRLLCVSLHLCKHTHTCTRKPLNIRDLCLQQAQDATVREKLTILNSEQPLIPAKLTSYAGLEQALHCLSEMKYQWHLVHNLWNCFSDPDVIGLLMGSIYWTLKDSVGISAQVQLLAGCWWLSSVQ